MFSLRSHQTRATALVLPVIALLTLAPLIAHADDRPFPAGLDVTIPCDTLTLAGTLYSDGATHRTGVVILTGSGEWDRRHPIRRAMIRCLIESGLVVLDFDKRGIGGTGGVYTDGPDLHERARDAAAAIRFLRARPEIDRVGVWGISQGGWVGQILAAEDPSLAFAILVSAPGVSPVLQSLYQRMERLRQEGWSDADVADAYVVRRLLWRYYQTGEGRPELERAWAGAKQTGWFAKLGWGDAPPLQDSLNAEQRAFFTQHGAYDPAPDLARSTVPTLCLFGQKDRHIPIEESVRETRAAFARNPQSRGEIRVFADAGHGMQEVTGAHEDILAMDAVHSGHAAAPPFELIDDYCDVMLKWLATAPARTPR